MRVAVYPFPSTGKIENNLRIIEEAVKLASTAGTRIIVFHECALCGYPPLESDIEQIKEDEIEKALNRVSVLARTYQICIAVGTVRFEGCRTYNSILLYDDAGTLIGCYDKTALWGWDVGHFTRGEKTGVFEIDGIKIGFRICFDVRFPESFRILYQNDVALCFICFSDTGNTPDMDRYAIIKAHLITRAVENVMTVVSVNSTSGFQTAPTAVINQNGCTLKETAVGQEELLVFDYEIPPVSFGIEGRKVNRDYFLQRN